LTIGAHSLASFGTFSGTDWNSLEVQPLHCSRILLIVFFISTAEGEGAVLEGVLIA